MSDTPSPAGPMPDPLQDPEAFEKWAFSPEGQAHLAELSRIMTENHPGQRGVVQVKGSEKAS